MGTDAFLRQRTTAGLLPALMATRRARTLRSDPDFLLSLMCEIEESDSEDDFEGWLDEDNGPTNVHDCPGSPTPLVHSASMDSMDLACEQTSPPRSPFLSPMQPSPETSPSQSAVNPPKFTARAGVIPGTEGLTPLDYFRLFFDERVIELIFIETSRSRYAKQYLEKNRAHLEDHPHARAHEWAKSL